MPGAKLGPTEQREQQHPGAELGGTLPSDAEAQQNAEDGHDDVEDDGERPVPQSCQIRQSATSLGRGQRPVRRHG